MVVPLLDEQEETMTNQDFDDAESPASGERTKKQHNT